MLCCYIHILTQKIAVIKYYELRAKTNLSCQLDLVVGIYARTD